MLARILNPEKQAKWAINQYAGFNGQDEWITTELKRNKAGIGFSWEIVADIELDSDGCVKRILFHKSVTYAIVQEFKALCPEGIEIGVADG